MHDTQVIHSAFTGKSQITHKLFTGNSQVIHRKMADFTARAQGRYSQGTGNPQEIIGGWRGEVAEPISERAPKP